MPAFHFQTSAPLSARAPVVLVPPIFRVTFLALAILFAFAATAAVRATTQNYPAPPPIDKRILIKSVNAKAGTVEIKLMSNHAIYLYKIDSLTEIKVKNAPATIVSVKVGMQVHDCVERDAHTLDTLFVDNADPAPK